MAKPLPISSSPGPHAASMASLSTEIVTHILEELQDVDPQGIVTIRRVCRTFNELATPLLYETVHINQRITSLEAEILFPHALGNIHAHARHIVLRSGLDRQCVGRLLNNLQKLRSVRYVCLPLLSETPGLTTPDLRWSFICNTGPRYHRWVPSDIASLTAHDPSKIKIHIEGLPLSALDGKHADLYRSVIPSQSLVSLETTAQQTTAICTVEPRLPSLKDLLLRSRSLEVFRYRGSGKATRFYFNNGERLPAFKELTLRSYDWAHDEEETASHWDFSQIFSLELVNVSMYNFFSSVSCRLHDFSNLHTLRVDDSGNQNHHLHGRGDGDGDGSQEESRRARASAIIHSLVRDTIHALHTLHLTCDFATFSVDALLRHGGNLKELVFRDCRAFTYHDLPSPIPTLSLGSLKRLARSMPKLEILELDLDIHHKSSTRHLTQLGRFPQLKILTLNISAVVGSQSQAPTWYTHFPDPDETCAKTIFHVLSTSKKTGPVAWESVTVKVGGWQTGYDKPERGSLRVAYHRRAGEGEDEIKANMWKALGKHGLFFKRCFVMERAGRTGITVTTTRERGSGGQEKEKEEGEGFVIREQRCVEMKFGSREHIWPR